jgi:hypothetical protein
LSNIEEKNLENLFKLTERLTRDAYYERALRELSGGHLDQVAEAMALEEAAGEREKARALYIKHRVRRIIDLECRDSLENEMNAKHAEKIALLEDAVRRQHITPEFRRILKDDFDLWKSSKNYEYETSRGAWLAFASEMIKIFDDSSE